ncbi:hypothetical protein V6N12_071808 [Hibiscus sabdariffa]|uniref:Uncharacterized protein n=1 Tax=Hibiscus sabdariffa TaxID=183260 RepID=A0ABR2FKW9_9ROSI
MLHLESKENFGGHHSKSEIINEKDSVILESQKIGDPLSKFSMKSSADKLSTESKEYLAENGMLDQSAISTPSKAHDLGNQLFDSLSSGGEWSAKQLEGEIESSAASTYELQRKLVQAAAACDSSGGVTSSFSVVTPSSAVFQVVIGGGGGGGFIGGGGGASAPAGGAAAAAEAPAVEEKKEEKEESDDDMGFSLFD